MKNSYLITALLSLFLIGFVSATNVTNQTIGAEPDTPYNLTDIPCSNPTCSFGDSPLFYFNDTLIPYGENNTHYGTNSNCQIIPYGEYDNGTDLVDSPYTDQDNPVNWSVNYEYTCESTTSETCTPIQYIMFNFLAMLFPLGLIFYIFKTGDKYTKIGSIVLTLIIFTLVANGIIDALC